MSRRSYAPVALTVAALLGSLSWALPAGSQTTDCKLSEAYQARPGGGTPITTDTTPYIGFTVTSPSSVAFPVDATHAQFCDATGQDRNATTGQIQGWTVPSGTPASGLKHVAPSGFIIQGIVVRAREITTSTTSTSTTTTTPGATTTTKASSTTTTKASTSTSTTTTTTTTVPVTHGPGNGPVGIRPDTLARTSPDAAAVRGNARLDVIVGGSDGHIYWSFQNQSPWSNYFDLGSPPNGAVGNPSIVSWGPGRLDVFARGADTRLWQTYSENGGQTWSPWLKPFGDDNVLASGPEASSRGVGRLNVYHVGTDGNVYERYYENGWNDHWLNQGRPDPGITNDGNGRDPTSVSWGGSDTERIDLFVRGSDNKLWQKYWDGSSWSSWLKPVGDDGVLASEPEAISWAPGNIVIFVRGTDNGAYALPFGSGGWATWVRLVKSTDTWQSGPGATSRGVNSFDLFMRGTDNITYYIWQ